MSLPERAALIIASAQGIGLATSERLAEAGFGLVMVDRDADKLATAAARLRATGAEVATLQADALNGDDVRAAVELAQTRFGRLDALACVAGGSGGVSLHQVDDIPIDVWNRVLASNLTTAYLACHHAVPVMRRQGYGRIVCLSSTVAKGRLGPVGTMGARLPYAAAKAGLIGFVKQLAKDVGKDGITVNAVLPWLTFGEPGTTVRDNFEALPEDYRLKTLAMSPQGRPITAAGVAAAIAFLLSEEAGYISGVELPIDGAVLN